MFQVEVRLALVAVFQRPAAVLTLPTADNLDRLGEALVAWGLDGLEVVDRAGCRSAILVERRSERKWA
jgi:hypothetical protein